MKAYQVRCTHNTEYLPQTIIVIAVDISAAATLAEQYVLSRNLHVVELFLLSNNVIIQPPANHVQ